LKGEGFEPALIKELMLSISLSPAEMLGLYNGVKIEVMLFVI
jgi:hypothetical protein